MCSKWFKDGIQWKKGCKELRLKNFPIATLSACVFGTRIYSVYID